jgi:hypothetical protein
MIYLSKPHGTHGVFHSTRSQGAYAIHKLEPGYEYIGGPRDGSFVGERDFLKDAESWADICDAANEPRER